MAAQRGSPLAGWLAQARAEAAGAPDHPTASPAADLGAVLGDAVTPTAPPRRSRRLLLCCAAAVAVWAAVGLAALGAARPARAPLPPAGGQPVEPTRAPGSAAPTHASVPAGPTEASVSAHPAVTATPAAGLDPALERSLSAHAVVAVRLHVTETPTDRPWRYVDTAAVERIDLHADEAVLVVLTVVLEGPAGVWERTTVQRHGVALRLTSPPQLVRDPWPLPDRPLPADLPPSLQPEASPDGQRPSPDDPQDKELP